MGVSVYVGHVEVKSVEQFPFLKAVLEKNTKREDVLGLECYVWEDVEQEAIYSWSKDVSVSDEQIKTEIESVQDKIKEQYDWDGDDDEWQFNKTNYIQYMIDCNHKVNSYYACVDL